ncbi:MAG: hypothetical protein COA99_13170 [Moraxellaceae bacterium]|nr:MAG: hypothetical protein COA99_13170 [Moraxellaceae bacterium]
MYIFVLVYLVGVLCLFSVSTTKLSFWTSYANVGTASPFNEPINQNGELIRAVPLTQSWAEALLKNLTDNRVLVVNTVSSKELNASSLDKDNEISRHFRSAFSFAPPSML